MNKLLKSVALLAAVQAQAIQWPEPVKEMKPWAYNWWMGSAVDAAGLDAQVEAMSAAGMGGFHVIPIYGVKGNEKNNRRFLSPEWMQAFAAAAGKARAAGLEIDLTTGTGWCFGGPQLPDEDGARMLVAVKGENPLAKFKPAMKPEILWQGKNAEGETVTLVTRLTLQKVKRSGPGGEGPMMDPFSVRAIDRLLEPYTAAFDAPGAVKPEHMYHDSYEYYNACWTPGMFKAFKAKRGYDLRDHLAELAGVGDKETIAKVKCDWRETLSDLMIEDVYPKWVDWCRKRGIKTRNEAHGAPANLLDFYALADIPETEMFGCGKAKEDDPRQSRLDNRVSHGDRDILISKFASSAAHVKAAIEGRTAPVYVSSESCTWMAEHFCETLEGAKGFIDRLFLSGVNRIYYHGTCYSPADAPWPGWCFYASLEMNPRNPIWRDAGELNKFITRVQSITQSAAPDEDVLVYWPIHDFWTNPDGFDKQLAVHALDWFHDQPVGRISRQLYDEGYAFDFISDRLLVSLARATLQGRKTHYTTILVPGAKTMPKETCFALDILQRNGYDVVFADCVPENIPGLMGEKTNCTAKPVTGDYLAATRARREEFNAAAGLMYTRHKMPGGETVYYIVNQLKDRVEGCFAVRGASAELMDPVTGRIEPVAVRNGKVKLSLPFGHGAILVVSNEKREIPAETPKTVSKTVSIAGPWRLAPVCGGPEGSFKPRTMEKLVSWARNEDGSECAFSGTVRYETTFNLSGAAGRPAVLQLGKVRESARVFVNGRETGVSYLEPKCVEIPAGLLKDGENTLAVEVTSTGANRIRDLDKRGVKWKIFNDLNMVDYYYKKFDASRWPLAEYGLFGPVRLEIL